MSDTGLVETETAAAPSARALTLVAELASIRDVARRVADALSARYMEVMWDLRREWPEGPLGDDGFSALLGRYGIDGEQAQRQIRVWDHARKHRKLRELADEAPGQAMEFVGRLARLGGDALPGPDEDPEVARIMTMPPRAMNRAIRRLLDGRAEPDVPPDAGEPADGGASNAGVARLPRATPESAHRAAVECEEKLAALAALVKDLPRRRQSPAWVDRMLQLVDLMGGHIDRIFCDLSGDENWERAED